MIITECKICKLDYLECLNGNENESGIPTLNQVLILVITAIFLNMVMNGRVMF